MEELDLFAEDNVSQEVKHQSTKSYQVVRLASGDYVFKKYNGSKAPQRYSVLGHFKLSEKSMKDSVYAHNDLEKRKIDGHKTIVRAKSDVLTQLDKLLPLLRSKYEFYPVKTARMDESEFALASQYCDELNEKWMDDKVPAELKALVAITRDLSHIAFERRELALSPEDVKQLQIAGTYFTSVLRDTKVSNKSMSC